MLLYEQQLAGVRESRDITPYLISAVDKGKGLFKIPIGCEVSNGSRARLDTLIYLKICAPAANQTIAHSFSSQSVRIT